MRALVAAGVLAPDRVTGPVAVLVEEGRVAGVWPQAPAVAVASRLPGVEVLDLGADLLVPGFVDIHVHGFDGHDLTSCSAEEMVAMARALPRTGATAFLATIASSGPAETLEQVRRARAAAEALEASPEPGAAIAGIRLEGPFISQEKRGAQAPWAIRPPDAVELRSLAEAAGGRLRAVDFAPEQPGAGALLPVLAELGLLPVGGHTTATYEAMSAAIGAGVRHSTHLFNAMPPLLHRAPGAAAAFLTDPRTTVEMIADGIHLHPAILRLVLAAKGPRSTALVTDAVHAAGLPEGDYEFLGRTVHVREGAVRLEDGTLAGSTLTLDRAVRNLVSLAGASLEDAVRMASETPAAIAGLCDRGSIRPGAWADLVELSPEGVVRATWTRGEPAWRGPEAG